MATRHPKALQAALLFLLALILLAGWLVHDTLARQDELQAVHEKRYQSYLLATQLRRSSDDLTRFVRSYAATGEQMFESNYWDVLAIRNGEKPLPQNYDRIYWDFLSVKDGTAPQQPGDAVPLRSLMKQAGFTAEEFFLLDQSQQYSDKLVELETTAINATKGRFRDSEGHFTITGHPDPDLALYLLYSDEYHQAKLDIMRPINTFYETLDQRTHAEVEAVSARLANHRKLLIGIFVLILATTVCLIVLLRTDRQREDHDDRPDRATS